MLSPALLRRYPSPQQHATASRTCASAAACATCAASCLSLHTAATAPSTDSSQPCTVCLHDDGPCHCMQASPRTVACVGILPRRTSRFLAASSHAAMTRSRLRRAQELSLVDVSILSIILQTTGSALSAIALDRKQLHMMGRCSLLVSAGPNLAA